MNFPDLFNRYLAGTYYLQTGVNPGLPAEALPPRPASTMDILNSPAVLLALGLTAFYLISKK